MKIPSKVETDKNREKRSKKLKTQITEINTEISAKDIVETNKVESVKSSKTIRI